MFGRFSKPKIKSKKDDSPSTANTANPVLYQVAAAAATKTSQQGNSNQGENATLDVVGLEKERVITPTYYDTLAVTHK